MASSYKAVDGFAAAEVDWLLRIGGIELRLGQRLGEQVTLAQLQADHDAVFLGMGLAGVNALRFDATNQRDAVDFIACNLCVDVCPVEDCITMRELAPGEIDARTGLPAGGHRDWTQHPNNPMVAAE